MKPSLPNWPSHRLIPILLCVLLSGIPLLAQSAGPPSPPPPLASIKYSRDVQIISRTPPVYPVIAREKHIEGTVILRLHIGADGNVRSVITEPDTLDYLLVKAAITAVLQWKFKPALDMHGHPTSRWIELPMRFGLSTRHH